ncbi:MAG: hypothetical protein EOP48_18415 [Sphingobacteriales bacterium]|nr:MAG: hypothetical protein EOP48_18415 [Sphingobacteriales bacterium]
MKQLLFILLLIYSIHLSAQDFAYPKIPLASQTLTGFIPKNWILKDSAAGDLNGDNCLDIALVIEYKDTIRERRPDGEVNTGSPRVLLVLFKDAKTGQYKLFLQNNTFIIRYGEGGMDPEAYGEVSISKGILEVFISFLRGNASYKFRFQNGDLHLIGGSSGGVSGGRYYGFDANFSTRRAKIEEGPIDADKTKVKWVSLPKTPLKKLREMKMIFQWEVVKDQYL